MRCLACVSMLSVSDAITATSSSPSAPLVSAPDGGLMLRLAFTLPPTPHPSKGPRTQIPSTHTKSDPPCLRTLGSAGAPSHGFRSRLSRIGGGCQGGEFSVGRCWRVETSDSSCSRQ